MDLIHDPWPWYIAGPLIGITVPLLMVLGNKYFGISSSLKHMCAIVIPAGSRYFRYDWKKEIWNLVFVAGIVLGAFLAHTLMPNPDPEALNPQTVKDLQALGITSFSGLTPHSLFSAEHLFSLNGLIFVVMGGFLVGFGTRYAEGCTSGHAISGLSHLQWPSLVATVCFFVGGLLATHVLFPLILK